ncbi:MAG: hypothetical protein JWM40_2968 [Frankiales bacterium]|nr:hypothetical protein [Frankiales bacterium]
MIRIELDEQNAVDVHGLLTRMQEALEHDERLVAPIRATKLALAGGLRASGWTPAGDGWEKRPVRSRR